MRIRSSEAKGIDSSKQPPGTLGKLLEPVDNAQLEFLKIDVWVWILEMQAGRDGLVFEDQSGFDQAGDAGRRLEVSDVRLDRTDETRMSPAFAQNRTERGGFDRVADGRSCTMRFDVTDFSGQNVRRLARLADKCCLCLLAGKGDAVGAAILVGRCAANDGVNPIAFGLRGG